MRMPLPGRSKLAGRVAIVAIGVVAGMLWPTFSAALAVAASVLIVLAGLSRTEAPADQSSEQSNLPRARNEAARRDEDGLDAPSQSTHDSGGGTARSESDHLVHDHGEEGTKVQEPWLG
jgi:hypothetical protein